MNRHTVLPLVATATLLVGCGGDDGISPLDCEPDTRTVNATTSTGSEVVFDWSPPCQVVLVLVEDGAADVWSVMTPDEENGIAPPVTYGVVPPGAEEGDPPTPPPLVRGETYELVLWRKLPDGSEALIAVEEFVR